MKTITVQTTIKTDVSRIWEYWTRPDHIPKWCFASDDWGARDVQNDMRVGGAFKTTMFAKDGSSSFEFSGTYTEVEDGKRLAYTISDGRKVVVLFEKLAEAIQVTETFEMENIHSEEKQREGWQSILNNFKTYVEATS